MFKNTKKTATKAYIYLRYSSTNQRQESIAFQRRAILMFCSMNSIKCVKEYVDAAKSATTDKRPAFQQMITDCQAPGCEVDAVIVYNRSRFARNRSDAAKYKDILLSCGINIISVKENFGDQPEAILLESLIDGLNEYYSVILASNVVAGLKENALSRKHTGGAPPLGYDLDSDGKLIINPTEAEAVKLIFSMYNAGAGYDAICEALNNQGFTTKKGKPFVRNSIPDILINTKYKGEYRWNVTASKDPYGKRSNHKYKPQSEIISIPGGCPAIVSEEIFEAAQLRKQTNKHSGGSMRAKQYYLLGGLKKLKCSYCGANLCGNSRFSGNSKTQYISYSCPNRKKHLCSLKEISANSLHRALVNQIVALLFEPSVMPQIVKKFNEHLKLAELSKTDKKNLIVNEIASLDRRIDNLADQLSSIQSDALLRKLLSLEATKNKLEHQLSDSETVPPCSYSEQDIMALKDKFAECLLTSNSLACRTLIDTLVDHIWVDNEKIEIKLNI